MNTPKKLIVGNWKMHTTIAEGSLLVNRLRKEIGEYNGAHIVLCPPATHLYPLHKELAATSKPKFELGVQNISEHEEGAYTGEVSAQMVSGLAKYVIIGHSERRKLFGETDKTENGKIAIVLRNGLMPILCIGESELARNLGHTKQVILDQLNACLQNVTAEELEKITIAYEPIWAIGNGNFAKPTIVAETILLIRNTIAQTFGRMNSTKVRVLYGGSVDGDNAKAYLDLQGIDGLLVGAASLNYKQFSKIILKTSPK